MKQGSIALAALVLSLLSGCAHDYLYVPVGPGAGGPAVRYPIPPGAPHGEAYVTSFGFTEVDAEPGLPDTYLHARLAVSNGSGGPWTVDSRTQSLVAPGRPPQGAAFLNTDAGQQGPLYQIPPGQARVFDMYFAMPPPLDQATNLGSFALDWNVDAGGQPAGGRTSFQRLEGSGASYDPYPPYVGVGLGFGVGWWYGPVFPYHGHYPPSIRRYYFPPGRAPAGSWRGVPPSGGGMRGSPPTGGGWRGVPPSGAAAGGWRGSPPGGSAVQAAPASGGMRGSPPSRGGGFRGGGGRGRGH